jgi:hypothetical protein
VLVYDVNNNRSFDTLNTWHDEFLNQVRMFNLMNYCVVWAWLQIVVQFLIYYLDIIVLAYRWFCAIYWLAVKII